MTYEDFTSPNYVEVDPNTRITVTTNKIACAAIQRNEAAYVYKDFGAGYFDGDFKIEMKITPVSAGASGKVAFFGMWNVLGAIADVESGNNGIYLYILDKTNGFRFGILERFEDADYYTDTGSTFEDDKWYGHAFYITAIRKGDSFWIVIHSDSERLKMLNSKTISIRTSGGWRYLYAFQAFNDSGAQAFTIDVENYERKTAIWLFETGFETGIPLGVRDTSPAQTGIVNNRFHRGVKSQRFYSRIGGGSGRARAYLNMPYLADLDEVYMSCVFYIDFWADGIELLINRRLSPTPARYGTSITIGATYIRLNDWSESTGYMIEQYACTIETGKWYYVELYTNFTSGVAKVWFGEVGSTEQLVIDNSSLSYSKGIEVDQFRAGIHLYGTNASPAQIYIDRWTISENRVGAPSQFKTPTRLQSPE